MKSRNFKKQLLNYCLLGASVLLLSSCNRGYGCPTNFSVDVFDALKSILVAVIF